MNSTRVLIVLAMALGLIILGQKYTNQSKKSSPSPSKQPLSKETLSSTPTMSQPETLTPAPTLTTAPKEKPPTTIPPTATPTNKQNQTISDLQYPGSIIISLGNNYVTFESLDDPKKITDWYKDKIKDMGMSATSFVQTNTNGNILNKLVGANGNREVRVEINKKNNSQTAKISIIG